jgi:hypothetical protein
MNLGNFNVDLSFQLPNEGVWRALQTELRIVTIDNNNLTMGLKFMPDPGKDIQQQVMNDLQMFISGLRE